MPVLRPQAPRNLGLTLVGTGTFAVIIAGVQYWQYIKKLKPGQSFKPWDLTFTVACFIGILGLLMFGSIILRAGPLG